MGDHTDYNEGFVLPIAIDRECVIASAPGTERVHVRSLDVPPPEQIVDVAADGTDDPPATRPGWGRYVAGLARALAERGRTPAGVDAVLSSTVPRGSGLSSSAALEVACALALCDAAGMALEPTELALTCQRAEHLATAVPSGIMDQLVSIAGVEDHALLIDCRTLERSPTALPPGLEVLAVFSGLERGLGGTAYAERRDECERLAAALGLAALRDATAEQVRDSSVGRHVVGENDRVLRTAEALAASDLPALRELFAASHASLRDDYRVSTPELDVLVEALNAAGAVGARLTGAGFGGSVVALCERDATDEIASAATISYRARTGREPSAFRCRAAAGAGPLPTPEPSR